MMRIGVHVQTPAVFFLRLDGGSRLNMAPTSNVGHEHCRLVAGCEECCEKGIFEFTKVLTM